MAPCNRSLSPLADLRRVAPRRLASGLVSLVVLALALLSAVPAGAVVTTVGGQKYGIEPAQSGFVAGPAETPLSYEGGPVVHSNATYAVYWDPHSTYSGAWQQLISGFLANFGSAKKALTNVFAVTAQYGESTGAKVAEESTFRGAYTDVASFPGAEHCTDAGTPCLTDAQIRTQLTEYIYANGLPTGLNPATGATPIYFVFTPPGITVCAQGAGEKGNCSDESSAHQLCGYHSFIPANPAKGLGTILYATQPATTVTDCQDGSGTLEESSKSLADLIVNEVADEQTAIVTDPLLNGWHDPAVSGDEDEMPDKCRNEFLPLIGTSLEEEYNQIIGDGNYYLNDEFDQAAVYAPYPGVKCINQVALAPEFTAQNPVNAGDALTFNATESDVALGVAKYQWNFGDGVTAEVNCGTHTPTNGYAPAECDGASGIGDPNSVASVVHHYTYGGVYEVTLTVTDDGGNKESVTHSITVEGSPPPSPAPPSPAAAPTGGSGSSGSSAASGAVAAAGSSSAAVSPSANVLTPKPLLPGPVASQAVVSSSLSKTLRSGLVVRYSVSQQVTGRFEVLLAVSLASRLGLHPPLATGLPEGAPAQVVIAKALLVTTRAGRGTIKIQFGKVTAARLRRLGKVSLMLRLNLRNATGGTTTALSKLTLR